MEIALDRDEARRIAVRAQRLDADRPAELVPLVEHLTFVQLDPTAAIAPSADLIAYTRIGAAYRPEQLRGHIARALDNGVTKEEVAEIITHLAFYSGWPASMTAARIAKEVFEERGVA